MPGPRANRGRYTPGSPSARRKGRQETQQATDIASGAIPGYQPSATPRQAAKEFVKKHVRFDADTGFPSFVDSAVGGIAEAVSKVEGKRSPSAASGIVSATERGGNTGNRIDTPKELKRIQREIREENARERQAPPKKKKVPFSDLIPELNPELSDFSNREQAKMREQREEKLKTPKYKSEMSGGAYGVTGRYPTSVDPALKILRPGLEAASLLSPMGLGKGILKTGLKGLLTKGGRAEVGRIAAKEGISKPAAYKQTLKTTKTGKVISATRRASRSKAGRAAKAGAVAVPVASGDALPAIEGIAKGTYEAPGKVAETTARGAIGLVAAPFAAGAAVTGSTGRLIRGQKDPLTPVTRLAEENWEEAKKQYEVFTSDDVDRIAKATQEDYGLWPAFGAAALARPGIGGVSGPAYRGVRDQARSAAFSRRQSKEGTPVPADAEAPPLFPRIAGQIEGKKIAVRKARENARQGAITAPINRVLTRDVRRMKQGEGKELTARLEDFSTRKTAELNKPIRVRPEDLAPFMVESRITNESPEAALAELDAYERYLDSQGADPDNPMRLQIEALREVPELLARPEKTKGRSTGVEAFWDTVDAYREGAATVPELNRSDVARRMPIAVAKDMLDPEAERILHPEVEAIPFEARNLTPAKTREQAVGTNMETYRRSDLHAAVKERRAERRKKNPDEKKIAALTEKISVMKATMGPVKLTKGERESALSAADLPTTPTKTVKGPDGKPRKTWSDRQRGVLAAAQQSKKEKRDEAVNAPLREEFHGLVDEEMERRGVEEPGFVKQRTPDEGLPSGVPFERAGTGKDHVRTGALLRQGRVVQDITDLPKTINGAARRDSQARFAGTFLDTYKFTHDMGEGEQDLFTKPEQDRLIAEGYISDRTHVRVASSYFDDEKLFEEVFGAENPKSAFAEAEKKTQQIAAEGEGLRSYIFKKENWNHFLAQQKALQGWERALTTATTVQSRLILATSFAWLISQPFAEVMPILLHDPNPARIARATRFVVNAHKTGNKKVLRDLAFIADTTPAADPATRNSQRYQNQTHASIQAMDQTPAGYVLRQAAKGEVMMEIDQFKGSLFREVATMMEVDKEVNSRTRAMTKAVAGIYDDIDKISDTLRTMNREEQLHYLSNTKEGRAAGEAFQKKIDEALGNWTALTPIERGISQAVLFYPFIRFSLDWTFRTFPKRHPVRFAVAGQMGQWNAEQLEKFLTHKPGFFSGWATIPYYGSEEGPPTSFIPAGRLLPGGNPFVEAAGDAESFGDLLKGASPLVKITTNVLGGRDVYGNPIEEDGKRTFWKDIKNLGEQVAGLTFPGRVIKRYADPPDTPGSPGMKEYAIRGGLWPFLPEDYRSAKMKASNDELWQKVEDGRLMASEASAEMDEMDSKWSDWKAEAKEWLEDKNMRAGFNSPGDIDRYVKVLTRPDSKNREPFKKYLEASLRKQNGEKQQEEAKKKLLKLYGREGKELPDSLKDFYKDEVDTGRSGPRAQREAEGKPMPAEDIVKRYSTNVPPKYGEEDRVRLNSKAVQAAGGQVANVVAPVNKSGITKPVATPAAEVKQAKQQAAKVNAKIAAKIGDERLTPEMVGEFARAAKVTGIPASVLAGIHRIEQGFGTVDSGGDSETRTSSDGTFLSSYNIMADAWGPGRELDRGAKALGYNKQLDPTKFGDGAIAAGIVLLNNGWKEDPEGAMSAYSGGGYGTEVREGLELIDKAKGAGGAAAPTVKNPNKRPFKGLMPVGGLDITKGMSDAKWDKIPAPGHGDTKINKAIAPIVRKWQKKYGIMLGEGYAPPPSDHQSAEHLETGTALDIYPRGHNWDENSKEFKDFKAGIEVLTKAGVTVLYDGSIEGTDPYPNHGYGNHAHVEWLDADGQGGSEALQKLTGMTNQQIADISSSVGSGSAGTTSYSGGGSSGGTSSGGSGGGTSSGGGGGSSSSSFSPTDFSKLSAASTIADVTGNLPSVGESPSVSDALNKLPDLPTARRKKRTYV